MNKEKYVVAVGAVCIDEYYHAKDWPEVGDKRLVKSDGTRVGGMIPNAACVFAGYGVKTYFYDVVNKSAQTQKLLEDLQAYGLDISPVVYDESLPDTKCIIVLTPGERTILVVDGEKPVLKLEGERLELFRNASYIYSAVSEMMHFERPVELARDLKSHGAQLVFDVEIANYSGEDEELLMCADILFYNEYAFENFKQGRSDEEYIEYLMGKGVKVITVTCGEKGSRTYARGERNRTEAAKFEVLDPTGAGDTFNSSFVRCLLEGMDIHEAAAFANMAAGYAVTRMGPKGGVQSVDNVEKLLAENPLKQIKQ